VTETTAYIGIGGNLGDAQAHVNDALAALAAHPSITLHHQSSLYRTTPIDSDGDDYVNAVVQLDTALDAHALLDVLQDIEQAHGRTRPYHNAPRTLDLDLLLYGEEVIQSPRLIVPHPRMTERAFVLVPLLEIAPDLMLPNGQPASDFITQVADQGISAIIS
jgi:2-amino-4-hydroxy-6-hydroxymethyldihydropteridine diphosphokinase